MAEVLLALLAYPYHSKSKEHKSMNISIGHLAARDL
jgi:hypothetical protein